MNDKKRTDRSAETGLSSRAAWRLLTRRRRALILFIETMLILVVAMAGHMTGREMGRRNLLARDATIQQLREERQEVSAELNKRQDQVSSLQIKLNTVQAALDAIVPSENTYNVIPNQSLILAGRVTVGLVGATSNQNVTLNINGKEHVVVAGDVITVAADGKTTCYITVQSFDMFKAVLNATCPTQIK